MAYTLAEEIIMAHAPEPFKELTETLELDNLKEAFMPNLGFTFTDITRQAKREGSNLVLELSANITDVDLEYIQRLKNIIKRALTEEGFTICTGTADGQVWFKISLDLFPEQETSG